VKRKKIAPQPEGGEAGWRKERMAEAKNRSRILILSHIAQFSLARRFGKIVYGGLSDMAFEAADGNVQPGDLIAIQSAPPSKWYLGWLVSKQWPEGHSCEQYSIESIEDGEICNWSNVGLAYYNREQISSHPEWRWTDAQHKFNDRWRKACDKERDAYIYLPMQPIFDNGGGVTLKTRTRHGMNDIRPERHFENWRKTTVKMMLEFYDEAVQIAKRERPVSA
jgi:hypothetical protein